jgi:ADP-ribose pyrophosphatase YjhB (NUDIX family)
MPYDRVPRWQPRRAVVGPSGQVDWDEPTSLVHRGVNVGRELYEEIPVFFLDQADAAAQPVSEEKDKDALINPAAPERQDAARDPSALIPICDGGDGKQDIVGVSAVVCDGAGRILLIRTANAGWELPGGRVEPGEDLITALVREVREEAECEIEVGRLTGITLNTAIPRTTIMTFLCRHISGEPFPGDDSLEVGWFAPDTGVGLVTHPVEQLRLKDALGDDAGVVYRAYRRLLREGSQQETFEMLGVHRC